MQIDEQCMRSTHKQWHVAVKEQTPSMKLPPVGSKAFHMANASNEESRQNDTMKRNQIGMEKEREAQMLRDENAALIERCQQLCDMAKNRTEHTMQERIQE